MTSFGWIVERIKEKCPGERVQVGSIPTKEGIGIYIAANAPNPNYADGGVLIEMSIGINAKFKNQRKCIDLLDSITKDITDREILLQDNTADRIINITAISFPVYIGQTEDESYMYGSSLRVKEYRRK